MDSRDQRGAVSRLVDILRKVTRLVQIAPFVYLALYSLYMICGAFVPDEVVGIADGVMSNSPSVIILFLVLSRLLRLCKWHKAACLIPSASQVEGAVDCYVFQFTQTEVILINILIGLVSLLFLAKANKRFFADGK